MVIASLILALSIIVSIVTVAQTAPPDLELLAFQCVALDPAQPSVVQFERESFPPSSDTGLFVSNGQQIAYVERGSLTIVGDRIGKAAGDEGFSVYVDPDASVGVRNDELATASVLWARIVPAKDRSQAAAYMSPHALRPLTAALIDDPFSLRPLFFEFDLLEPADRGAAYLVMARIGFDSTMGSVSNDGSGALTSSGTVAFVVETGELQVNDGTVTRNVFPGEGMMVPGETSYTASTLGEATAQVFLVGVIGADDKGRIGAEIASVAATDRHCSGA